MPNHVHIVAVPRDEDGLRRCFRFVHRHYTGYINARHRCGNQGTVRKSGDSIPRERHLRIHRSRELAPALQQVGDFAVFMDEEFDEALTYAALRTVEGVGRPVGSPEWLADMEARTAAGWRRAGAGGS